MSRAFIVRVTTAMSLAITTVGALMSPGSPAAAYEIHPYPPGYYNGIAGTVLTTGNMSLRNAETRFTPNAIIDSAPPHDVGADTATEWRVKTAPGKPIVMPLRIQLRYEILDRDKQPTGLWADAYFNQPVVGANTAECGIFRGHPERGGVQTLEAPYACGWSNFGPNDWVSRPILSVRSAIEITDSADAGRVLEKFCSHRRTDVGCVHTNVRFASFLGEGVMASRVYANHGGKAISRPMEWEIRAGESIGVAAGPAFEAHYADTLREVAAQHGRTWVSSYTKSGMADLSIPARSAGWWQYAPPMQSVTGDWVVNIGHIVWLVRDVASTGPNPQGRGMLTGCTGGLEHWSTDNTCA